MGKRNAHQRLKRNESRKNFLKDGKKALFCMAHINTLYPEIFKEVSDLYESLKYLYPSKRNLMKTELYIKQYAPGQNTTMQHLDMQNFDLQHTDEPTTVQNTYTESETQSESTKPKTRRDVEPSLKIQLIENPQVPIVNEDQTEKLLQETYELISELQQDPELQCFFSTIQDETTSNITLTSLGEESGSMTIDQEIDQIIREEFDLLGADLPNIVCEDDELSRLANM